MNIFKIINMIIETMPLEEKNGEVIYRIDINGEQGNNIYENRFFFIRKYLVAYVTFKNALLTSVDIIPLSREDDYGCVTGYSIADFENYMNEYGSGFNINRVKDIDDDIKNISSEMSCS